MKNTVDNTRDIKVLNSQLSAFIKTISEILNNSNTAETARYASYADMARIYNDLANRAKDILNVESIIYTFNLGAIPNRDDTVWPTQKRVLEQVLLSARILLSSVEEGIDFADDEFDNLENFLQFRLRSAIFQKPELEVEIQNAIESLLLGRGLSKGTDYDRESGKVEFSGKEYIPDFIVPKMSLCIEVKLLRENRKSKIIEEISADITAYKKIYNRQLFVVYDLGVIQNELEFKRDIEMSVGVKVIIVKHEKPFIFIGESQMNNNGISFFADSGKLIVEGSSLSRDQKEAAKLQIDCVADLIDYLQKASAARSSMNIPQYTLSLDYLYTIKQTAKNCGLTKLILFPCPVDGQLLHGYRMYGGDLSAFCRTLEIKRFDDANLTMSEDLQEELIEKYGIILYLA